MRHSDCLRGHVTSVPMILVSRMQNKAEIRALKRADYSASVDNASNALQALRELDVIDCGIDTRKGAQYFFGAHAGFERRVSLGVEGLGLRHSTRHPENDHRVGCSRWSGGMDDLGFAADQRGKRGACGGTHECAAANARANEFFFDVHKNLSATS